jgi:hypothetical protein
MPVACVEELITALQKIKSSIDLKAPQAAADLNAPQAATDLAIPKAATDLTAPKATTQLKVTVPKTWLVTADLKQRGVVILAFDHQAETRVGYALAPDAAKKMGASLNQNAEAVLSHKSTNGSSSPIS